MSNVVPIVRKGVEVVNIVEESEETEVSSQSMPGLSPADIISRLRRGVERFSRYGLIRPAAKQSMLEMLARSSDQRTLEEVASALLYFSAKGEVDSKLRLHLAERILRILGQEKMIEIRDQVSRQLKRESGRD